jgi:transcriptional regulator with XRE-family HTH domain
MIHIPVDPLLAIRLELRWARADAAMTQATLAKKLRMSQQQLARLESGESNPTVRTIARVAHGLGRRVVMTLEKSAGESSPLLPKLRAARRIRSRAR